MEAFYFAESRQRKEGFCLLLNKVKGDAMPSVTIAIGSWNANPKRLVALSPSKGRRELEQE